MTAAKKKAAHLFRPWAGLVAAVTAAGTAHQFGADGTFDHCAAISPVPLLIVAALCIGLALFGALVSAAILRGGGESSTRKLAATISTGMAALCVFAIALPMTASLILPPCFQ